MKHARFWVGKRFDFLLQICYNKRENRVAKSVNPGVDLRSFRLSEQKGIGDEMNQKESVQSIHKMANMPVRKLMLSMSLPMVLSMALQALYNIVDSAFVSNMAEHGEEALNALTLAFPVQMLMVAVAIGTGVGANALLAKSLGQENRKKASEAAGNSIFLGAVIFLLFFLFGLFGVRAYIATQTNNALVSEMAVRYLKICCLLSFGIVFFSIFEKLLQATGRSLYSTIAQVTGAVVNVILDPVFIYGWFGVPKLGVSGAAIATVTGQIASFVIAFGFYWKSCHEIDKKACYLLPKLGVIGDIYKIGLPAMIAQALMSAMTYLLNLIFVTIDEGVVTAYGLYYKIQQFVLFAAFGLRDAITPIVSYAHGMGSKERIRLGIRYGMLFTLVIMAAGLVLIELFAKALSSVFGLSGITEGFCIDAMRLVSLSFLFAGVNIAFQGVFQALDSGTESLVISVCRQLLFVIPLAWLFSRFAASNLSLIRLVWLTFPIAEGITAVIALLLMKRIDKKKIQTGKETESC